MDALQNELLSRVVMLARFCIAVAIIATGFFPPILSAQTDLPADGVVRYSQFGAKGDGETDDIDAIVQAHEFANEHGLPVRADDGATYYISGRNRTALIQTDIDFGTAAFLIDDTDRRKPRSSRVPGKFEAATVQAGRGNFAQEEPGKNRRFIARTLPGHGHRFQRETIHSVWAGPQQRSKPNGCLHRRQRRQCGYGFTDYLGFRPNH